MDPCQLGLPHRAPFLFIDSIEEHEPGRRAVGVKVFPSEDPVFAGHFPGNPIVPGVLITEALAQTAGVAANGPGDSVPFRLCAIRQMKILAAVRPNEEVRLEATVTGEALGMVQFSTRASVAGQLVAEGQIVLSRPQE